MPLHTDLLKKLNIHLGSKNNENSFKPADKGKNRTKFSVFRSLKRIFESRKFNSEEKRIKQANLIVNSPEFFQVCCGCESIVPREIPTCDTCNAYRFDMSHQNIISQAAALANMPRETLTLEDFY